MSELLGEAVLELDADLGPLDRALVAAEAKVAAAMAAMQRMMDRELGTGASSRFSVFGSAFDQQITSPLARFGATADKMGKQVDGSLAQVRIEQAATTAEMEKAAAVAKRVADAQVIQSQRVAKAYAEEAAAAKLSADQQEAEARRLGSFMAGGLGPSEPRRASEPPGAGAAPVVGATQPRGAEHASPIMGIKGPGGGSVQNPIVVVIEAGTRTGMGSMAAAIGAAPVSGGAPTTTVAQGGQGQGATTVMTPASSGGGGGGGQPPIIVAGSGGHGGGRGDEGGGFIPLPWWMGGGHHVNVPGGSTGLLAKAGVGTGLLGLAGAGTAASFAGLDAAHLLMTGLGLAGSAAGAAGGAGLLGLGGAGALAVGQGSDIAVMKSTIADTKALSEGYKKVQEAVALYGKESKQAAVAQKEMNLLMSELGNTAGVKAEVALGQAGEKLNKFWDLQTSQARVKAVEILKQVIAVGTTFVPHVAKAAQENLSIINQGIKPLFAWLQGAGGLVIFNKLENTFRNNLPTAIKAGTQGIEFFGRLTAIAAEHSGGLILTLEHLFTKLNAMSNPQISGWVTKFIDDFKMWTKLIKVAGEDIFFLFRNDAGTAAAIVTGLTHALEKLREWEKSAKGSAEIRNIFIVHKEQIEALGRAVLPLIEVFGKLYLAIAPTAVEATIVAITKVITPLAEGLNDVAGSGKAAATAMGILLVSWKAFGLGGTITMLKNAFGWLTGAEKVQAAAALEDAGAQQVLLTSTGASTSTAAGRTALATAEGAGGAAAAKGLPGLLQRIGAGVRGVGTKVAGEYPSVGESLLLSGVRRATGSVATGVESLTSASTLLPIVATTFAFIEAKKHLEAGQKQEAKEHPHETSLFAPLENILGLKGKMPTVEIKDFQKAAHGSVQEVNKLIKEIEKVGRVKVAGVSESAKEIAAQLKKAREATESFNKTFNTAWTQIHNFALGSGPILRELYDRFHTNFRLIESTIGGSSEAGRHLAEDNVDKMVSHIGVALHRGEINTKSGMAGIANVIKDYTTTTGDQTPRIYEAMFAKISAMYKHHEIGTKTAFTAYSAVAGQETKHEEEIVTTETAKMFAKIKEAEQGGHLSHVEAEAKEKKLRDETTKRVEAAMQGQAESIVTAMEAGSITTADAGKIIGKNLNEMLTHFGAKPLSEPQLKTYMGRAELGHKLSQVAKMEGFGTSAAGGGMYQIGRPGEHGADSIPMNIGGQPVMVAPGEVAAVFNRHQLPVVDSALAPIGGLQGLFNAVQTPHHMAKGGFTGYSLPLPKGSMMPGSWSIDQGVDIPAGAGTPEFAIGPGQIIGEGISGFGPNAPILKISAGPLAGKNIYYGHAGADRVPVGAHVHAGQQISEVGAGIVGISSGPHIEIGFGPPFGRGNNMAQVLHELLGGAGVVGQGGGAATSAEVTIKAPTVHGTGTMGKIARADLNKIAAAATSYLSSHAGAGLGAAGVAGTTATGQLVPGIMAIERQAAAIAGLPFNESIVAALLQHESAGGINEPPSGELSATGPNQVIPSTFAQYAAPGHGHIGNPLDNAIASMRYIKSRYGSLERMAASTKLLSGGYKGYAAGGFIGMAGGGTTAKGKRGKIHHSASKKVTHPKASKKVALTHAITALSEIPGWGPASQLGGPQGVYNTLTEEMSLLGGMTGNAASIMAGDMSALQPTLASGESIVPGMLVPQAEHQLQRALQHEPESENLQLQSSILGYLGGLDTHRLLNAPDIGVLAKDFHGGGLRLHVGDPIFLSEEHVIDAQIKAQKALAVVLKHEIDKAIIFIAAKKKRKKALEHLLAMTYKRYVNIKVQIEEIVKRRLQRNLTAAQRNLTQRERADHNKTRIKDAHAQEKAIGHALSLEKAVPTKERNHGLVLQLEGEKENIAAYINELGQFEGESVSEAHAKVVTAGEAIHASKLRSGLRPIGEMLHTLGGDSTRIGKGGELQLVDNQVTALNAGQAALSKQWKESTETTTPGLELSLANLKTTLQEAAEGVVPGRGPGTAAGAAAAEAAATTEKPGQAELINLQRTQIEQTAQALAVSQAQYKVLANLAPFGGKFHGGGVVPGPLGADRMILAQGGEIVLPAGGATPKVDVNVADGMSWLKGLIRTEVTAHTRDSSRNAFVKLPGAGGGSL